MKGYNATVIEAKLGDLLGGYKLSGEYMVFKWVS